MAGIVLTERLRVIPFSRYDPIYIGVETAVEMWKIENKNKIRKLLGRIHTRWLGGLSRRESPLSTSSEECTVVKYAKSMTSEDTERVELT